MTIDSAAGLTGPFWDAVAGRVDMPPSARTLGWAFVDADPAQGTIRVAFEAREEFVNPLGNIQGGFLAAMLDDTLGPAIAASLPPDQFPATLELKINFLRPTKPGRLVGTGRVVHRGGSIAFLEGELRDDEGNLLATATSTVRLVRRST